jgi:TRAP-type C4-dicarboxylate transport system permease small subunit
MWLERVTGFLTKLNRPFVAFVKYVALWVLAGMMFLTFTDVLLRYLFNRPVPGGDELIEFMMAIVVTFCLAYTAHERSHVGVDLLITRFSKKTRKLIGCITSFLTLGLFILICWQTIKLIGEDYSSHLESGVLYIPVYPFIATVAAGLAILCLILLTEFLSLVGEVVSEWIRS